MLAEALDITIESRGKAIRLGLAGPFNREQIDSIKSKLESFIRDGHHDIIVDLDKVTIASDGVAPMFLALYNMLKGKGGSLRLIFRNETVTAAFAQYRNILTIFPDERAMVAGGIIHNLRRQGLIMSRKTGIRLSRPVALFILFLLLGWFASMGFILNMQHERIMAQDEEIRSLTQWKLATGQELTDMRERLRPLTQLGLLGDSIPE